MPSSQFAKKRVDPPNIFFKLDQNANVRYDIQDIQHFCNDGYTTLMDSSQKYGCLVFAIKNTLRIQTNDTIYSMVSHDPDKVCVNRLQFPHVI